MALFLKRMISAMVICLSLPLAYAAPTTTLLTVPFQNIPLNPNATIQASYAFGENALIFCYENNLQSVGSVSWPYRGKLYSSTLSVTLTPNGNYQGQLADPTGTITVANNQTITLIVNCQFAF